MPDGYSQPLSIDGVLATPAARRHRSRSMALPAGASRSAHAIRATATPCDRAVAHVLAEVEIDVRRVGIERGRDVADSARARIDWRNRTPSIPAARRGRCRGPPTSAPWSTDRIAPMRGNWRSGRPHRSGGPLVMVVAVPRAGLVRNDRFHPDTVPGMRRERHRTILGAAIRGTHRRPHGHAAPRADHEQARDAVDERPRRRIARVDLGGQIEPRRREEPRDRRSRAGCAVHTVTRTSARSASEAT